MSSVVKGIVKAIAIQLVVSSAFSVVDEGIRAFVRETMRKRSSRRNHDDLQH